MYIEYQRSENLPDEWDMCVASNPHLCRSNLALLERTNPCSQRYVAFLDQAGHVNSALVLYRLKLNLLTYSSLSLPVNVAVVGAPYSVAAPGYVVGESTKARLTEYVTEIKGLVVILNTQGDLPLPGWSRGVTLPDCQLTVNYSSFADYIGSMRSHYRYRYRMALKKGLDLQVAKLSDNRCFDGSLYDMYSQVYEKSDFKLEKLAISFFRQSKTDIYVFASEGFPVGFVQLKQYADQMQFLFGGIDYNQSSQYDTYVNMLLFIVKESIERDCKLIDFGQTAEDAKARLGCQLHPKFMYVRHSNRGLNFAISKLIRCFDYRAPKCDFRVFKKHGG